MGHEPYRLPEDLIGEGGDNVAKATDAQGKMRMPKQYVRPGRGVAGYTGNVEVYDSKRPEKAAKAATPEGDVVNAEKVQPTKINKDSMNRAQLESIGQERGLTQAQMDACQTKAELVELLEQAGP